MSAEVRIPTPLQSYTSGAAAVRAEGASLRDLMADLEHRFAGIRFRVIDEQGAVRTHIQFFIGDRLVRDLGAPVKDGDTVHLICALSGG